MFERIMMLVLGLVGLINFFFICKLVKETHLNFLCKVACIPPLVLMTLGMLVNWVVVGNTDWVWNMVPYSMMPIACFVCLGIGKGVFEFTGAMFGSEQKAN